MAQETKETTALDVIQRLKQIEADSKDGALTFDGLPLKIGMKREEVDAVQQRQIDALTIHFQRPDSVVIKYSSQIRLEQVHEKGFEDKTYGIVEDIKNHIQKEYKRRFGESLSLKEKTRNAINVQYVSQVSTYITAGIAYSTSAVKADYTEKEEKPAGDKFKEMLKKSISDAKSAKKPSNDTRKEDTEKPKA